jgi:serine/threonine-protein kinase
MDTTVPDGYRLPDASRLLGGRYRLFEVIGEGGMAVVHLGRDELLDRDVAVKVLRQQFSADPDFVARFRAEARNAAALAHPNVVPIFDTGVDDGVEYIVMQLIDGVDLDRILAERGRLPVAEALRIGVAAAEALAAAHARGIVHRDIKPGNILLDRDGDVRVVDFGIARALGDTRTTTAGLMLGSVQYCSPEQVLGEVVGPASDVFSLGAVLYELLTGRRAWDGDSPAAVALARLRETPPRPSAVVPDLPPGLDGLILTAMSRSPAERFPSAEAMAEAIRAWWRRHRVEAQGADPRRVDAATRRRAAPTGRVAMPGGLAPAGAAAALGARSAALPRSATAAGGTAAPSAQGRGDHAATRAGPVTGDSAPPWRPATLAAEPRVRRRRRGAVVPRWLLPAVVALGLVAILLVVLNPLGRSGGVGGATSSPQAAVLGSDSATPAPTPTVALSPTPTPALTPPPTPAPTPAPTPPPTPPPTPAPTPRPATPEPQPQPPVEPAADPSAVVASFYRYVVDGEFREAEALWTAEMRNRYPPRSNIDGRFGQTTRIDLNRNAIVQQDADSAYVEVDLTEYQSDGEVRRYVGGWDLLLTADGWRLHDPDLSQVQ